MASWTPLIPCLGSVLWLLLDSLCSICIVIGPKFEQNSMHPSIFYFLTLRSHQFQWTTCCKEHQSKLVLRLNNPNRMTFFRGFYNYTQKYLSKFKVSLIKYHKFGKTFFVILIIFNKNLNIKVLFLDWERHWRLTGRDGKRIWKGKKIGKRQIVKFILNLITLLGIKIIISI